MSGQDFSGDVARSRAALDLLESWRVEASAAALDPDLSADIGPVDQTPWTRDWDIDPVPRFLFSALTFNGHRVHRDAHYAQEEEDYPGFVIHGPLVATRLGRLAEQQVGRPIARFAFSSLPPSLLGAMARLRGRQEASGRAVVRALTPGGDTGLQAVEFE